MPLFRFHRGGLQDSLETTIIVKTRDELLARILDSSSFGIRDAAYGNYELKIDPYPFKEICFDSRIGWYTQIVTGNIYEEDKFHPIGFLSEPF